VPRLTASKEEVKGPPPMPEGLYTLRCDGFKPRWSKDKGSVNLNPILKITNHHEHNDRIVFENLNTKAKWIWTDFSHAFGVPYPDATGSYDFPGDFPGDKDNPETWQYVGPLLGQLCQVYLVQADDTKGGVKNAIKFYVCKIPGCGEKHSANLVK
jgi:hypothetical protein